ncbi:MAG: YSC84-related protein [Rubrimonas sp.]|uniref:lipid-binding SYLF domain-containing protein n=1 Tax=Rubrimonas sp. TaxID=2036015 RepID=UPI002FDE159A
MSTPTRRAALSQIGLAAVLLAFGAATAQAEEREIIDTRVRLATEELRASVPGAAELLDQARGVLIMPNIVKGGLIVGGAYGEGALLVGGETVGYYALAAASLGFQLGVQSSKQALLFMTDASLEKFRASQGWQAGVDAEVTMPGDGLSAQLKTTSREAPVIAIVFGQDGLLAGASLEGAKFSPIAR